MKKAMKRILSFALAMAMILAMGITVSAEEVSITIKNKPGQTNLSIKDKTYDAYKIFHVRYDDQGHYDYRIVDELEKFEYEGYTGQEIVGYLLGLKKDDHTALQKFAKAVFDSKNLTAAASSGDATTVDNVTGEESKKIDLNTAGKGYYLVSEQEGTEPEPISAFLLTTTDPTGEKNVKGGVPKLDKNIVDSDSGDGKGTAVEVGKAVAFKITSEVPDLDETGYTGYKFIITDTLSSGLTPPQAADVNVYVNGQSYDDSVTKNVNGPVITITFNNLLTDYNDGTNTQVVKNAPIEVSYSAVLNEKATETNRENNSVSLKYSSNPKVQDGSKTLEIPPVKTFVYDFSIKIKKHEEGDETTPLENAKFVLYKKVGDAKQYYYYNETDPTDPNYKKVDWKTYTDEELKQELQKPDNKIITEVTTGADGLAASFKGLEEGTYYLHETESPAGYSLPGRDVEIVIDNVIYEKDEKGEGKEKGRVLSYDVTVDGSTSKVEGRNVGDLVSSFEVNVNVPNTPGSELPETGGMGTTLFYVFGGLLVLAAAGMLIAKKRTPETNQE